MCMHVDMCIDMCVKARYRYWMSSLIALSLLRQSLLLNPGLASSARLSSQLALEILSCARIEDRPLHWPSIYRGTEDLNSCPLACPEIALASGTLSPYFF